MHECFQIPILGLDLVLVNSYLLLSACRYDTPFSVRKGATNEIYASNNMFIIRISNLGLGTPWSSTSGLLRLDFGSSRCGGGPECRCG